jgi:hypothetical protein
MKTTALALAAAVNLASNASATQTPDVGAKPPSAKNQAVVVQGCVSGPLLRELRVQNSHMPMEKPATAVVYRLTGEKKMLQLIRKEHEDQLLEVSGEITSLKTDTVHTKEKGRLKVYATDGRPEVTEQGKPDSYPTLRVTSFEVIRPYCEQ